MAAEPHPCDMLIQEILNDLKRLNDKIALLRMLLGRGEPLREADITEYMLHDLSACGGSTQ
jgi:hypothetical protein